MYNAFFSSTVFSFTILFFFSIAHTSSTLSTLLFFCSTTLQVCYTGFFSHSLADHIPFLASFLTPRTSTYACGCSRCPVFKHYWPCLSFFACVCLFCLLCCPWCRHFPQNIKLFFMTLSLFFSLTPNCHHFLHVSIFFLVKLHHTPSSNFTEGRQVMFISFLQIQAIVNMASSLPTHFVCWVCLKC